MDKRQPLLDLLRAYTPYDHVEAAQKLSFIQFVETTPDCFLRENLAGHVTASAWVLSECMGYVLLNHHKKFDSWKQFGGHADGMTDVLDVAQKECDEETGLKSAKPLTCEPFDVSVHYTPEYNGVPEHLHYDVGYVFTADKNEPFIISEESNDIQWVALADVPKYVRSDDVRMHLFLAKTLKMRKLAA